MLAAYASHTSEFPAEMPKLPDGFEWVPAEETSCEMVADFLRGRYVADDSGQFVLEYSTQDIESWAPDIIAAIRSTDSKKTLGVLCGRVVNLRVFGAPEQVHEANFACVHNKLRGKKMLNVLFKGAASIARARFSHIKIFTFTKQNRIPGSVPANQEPLYEAHLCEKTLQTLGFQTRPVRRKDLSLEEPIVVDGIDTIAKHDLTFDIRFQLCPDWTKPEEWGKRLWGHGLTTYTWSKQNAWVTVGTLTIRHKPTQKAIKLVSVHYVTPGRLGTRRIIEWVVQRHLDTHDLLYAFPSAHTSQEVLTSCGLHAVEGVHRSIYLMNVPGPINVVSSDYFVL